MHVEKSYKNRRSVSYNFHPPLSAFPVALICVTALLEIAMLFTQREWLTKAAGVCLCVGAVFAGAAFLSGYSASSDASLTFPVPPDVIVRHHVVGRFLLFALVPCVALHFITQKAIHAKLGFRIAYLASLGLCVALVLYTGYLGGTLVFRYGAGVGASLPAKR